MESNYHEESSTEDQSDEESKDLGVGRSYECVFCKRGFNTAQALGGHMNIHRKDRARNKPKEERICYAAPRLYPSSSTNDQSPHNQDHPMLSYASFFPESAPGYRPANGSSFRYERDRGRDHRQPLMRRMSLSLGFPPAEEKDLDLELRLGYDS